MNTKITSDNGVEIKVAQLGMGVVHPEGITSIWARLSDAQRVELAAALDPGRHGLHVRLDNQAATLATYRRELDEALRKKGEAFDRAVRAERERDEWKARAEAAERDRDDDYSERSQKAAAWDRVAAHPALSMDLLPEADHTYAGGVLERITQLAEAAEARTAPAVTREDVRGVIDHWIVQGGNHEALLDDLWRWVSGDDPAVHVVRESDLPEVGRTDDGWTDGTRHGWEGTSETAMECVETHLEWARFYAAAARAIEAEQAADPLLAKAQEFAALADWELTDREAGLIYTVARHVLGQEAGDE